MIWTLAGIAVASATSAVAAMMLYLYWELRWEVKYLESEHIKLIQRALRAEAQLYETNTDRKAA